MKITLAKMTRVSFFPINLINKTSDEMQTDVEVREKAMAVPSGKWLYCRSGCNNNISAPLQKYTGTPITMTRAVPTKKLLRL